MNRPFVALCRSLAGMATVIGVRANAIAIDVPSSRRSVLCAAGMIGRNPSWEVSATYAPS